MPYTTYTTYTLSEASGWDRSAHPLALEMTSNLGTTAWCAPELLTQGDRTQYSVKVQYNMCIYLYEWYLH